MKNWKFAFILLILTSGCKTIQKTNIPDVRCKNEYYFPLQFPESASNENDKLDKSSNEWYSELLCSIKEPILYNLKDKDLEVYRFSLIGPWDSGIVAYRIEKKDSIILLSKSSINGKNSKFNQLSNLEDYMSLEKEIDSLDFWKMFSHSEFGKDGEEWILESYKKGQYHFVDRWSPDDTLFIQTCMLIQKLCENKD